MVTFAAGLTLASAGAPSVGTPESTAAQNHDPSRARPVTSDILNFSRASDRASLTEAADLFQHEYRAAHAACQQFRGVPSQKPLLGGAQK